MAQTFDDEDEGQNTDSYISHVTREYECNGSTNIFPISWPYLDRDYVVVTSTVKGITESKVDISTAIEWLNDSQIRISPPPPSGTLITITRQTPSDDMLVKFKDGSAHLAADLNTAVTQLLHIFHEERDYIWWLLELQLRRIQEAVERAENIAELGELHSFVNNIRRSWRATENTPDGGILTLPAAYYPGRNMLLLMHEGTVCDPIDVLSPGTPQYTEIGNTLLDEPSYQVRVHFPVAVGEKLSMWVIASNAWRVSDEVTAALEGTRENVQEVKGVRDEAVAAVELAIAAQVAAQLAASEVKNLKVTLQTLAPGSTPTVSYNSSTGILTIGMPPGERGDDGKDGTSVTILGSFNSPSQLPATATPGSAYMVNGDLYIWSANTNGWVNVGSIRGPVGPMPTLSDSVTGTSSTIAASEKAVKTVNDKAVAAQSTATAAQSTATAAQTTANGAVTAANAAQTAANGAASTANAAQTTANNALTKANAALPVAGTAVAAKKLEQTNITGQTVNLNGFIYPNGYTEGVWICQHGAGSAGITPLPLAGNAFRLELQLLRRSSNTDYIQRMILSCGTTTGPVYDRLCVSGVWGEWNLLNQNAFPMPKTGAGVGQLVVLSLEANQRVTLPPGETWEWLIVDMNHNQGVSLGVDAGGTVVFETSWGGFVEGPIGAARRIT